MSVQDRRARQNYYAKNWERILAGQRRRYAEKVAKEGKPFHDKNNAKTRRSNIKLGLPHRIFQQARNRAKKLDVPFTIKFSDLTWPTHCPVFDTKLNYAIPNRRKLNASAQPSLDRFNNKRWYVKGNVRVVSMKANTHKGNLSAAELRSLVRYAEQTNSIKMHGVQTKVMRMHTGIIDGARLARRALH
jgi:hypothetical protein